MQVTPGERTALQVNAVAIDHIALCVEDLEESVRFYTEKLGFSLVSKMRTDGESTGMLSAVVKAGPVVFVLLQGTTQDSHICRFIEKFGPGVQHVAISVKDLPETASALQANGIGMETEIIEGEGISSIYTTRQPHFGVRLELVERRGGNFSPQTVEKAFRTMERNNAL
jgi:methylmalonyl-CoA/ethylmalonyl-CoA epimerase